MADRETEKETVVMDHDRDNRWGSPALVIGLVVLGIIVLFLLFGGASLFNGNSNGNGGSSSGGSSNTNGGGSNVSVPSTGGGTSTGQ